MGHMLLLGMITAIPDIDFVDYVYKFGTASKKEREFRPYNNCAKRSIEILN